MIDHYDAFISYKHGELDSKIAERVQHKLEHFHIPGKIAKRTGKKKITRIFRDKEELPITSNLTDTISYALEHSDYLIVICSTRTKLSTWVTREIKVFLETHPRNRVLTVLCDGEPGDVIPEELLYEEHEVTDDNGTVHKVKVPLEPLSCDYRMSFRKADREELPRLAAPIIGCSYDELMRRRRVYRIQRATAIGSAVLAASVGFGLYMMHSKKEVQRHYEEALRNRAISLAWEADRLYEEQEIVKSLQVALASLPSEEDSETPVTYDALRAITRATGAYVPAADSTVFLPTWNYSMPGKISDFKFSTKRSYMVGMDDIGNFICWDINSHKEKYRCVGAQNCGFYDDNTLIILYENKVVAVDVEKESVEWEYVSTSELCQYILEFRESSVYVSTNSTLIILDSKKGKEIKTCMFDSDDPMNSSVIRIPSGAVSPDGKKLALAVQDLKLDCTIMIYDIESNSSVTDEESYEFISQLFWADNDNLIYLPSTMDEINNYYMDSALEQISETTFKIFDMDPVTAKDRWSADFSCFSETSDSGELKYLKNQDAVLFYRGFSMSVFDLKTGEVLHSYVCNDDILCTFENEDTGSIMFVSAEGDFGYTVNENGKDFVRMIDTLSPNVAMASMGKGIFIVKPTGKEIIHFKNDVNDDNWIDLSPEDKSPILQNSFACYVYGDELVISSYDGNTENYTLTVVDQNKGKITDQFELEGSYMNYGDLVKVGDYCYIDREIQGKHFIQKFSLKKGKVVSEFELETEFEHIKTFAEGEKFWYVSKDKENAVLVSFDPLSEKYDTYDLDVKSYDIKNDVFFVDDGKKVIYMAENKSKTDVYLLDIKTEDIELIETNRDSEIKYAYCNDDYFIIGDSVSVNVISVNHKRDSYELNCPQLGPLNCYEHNGILYLLFKNGLFGEYNAKDGSLIKTVALFTNYTQAREIKIGNLYLQDDTLVVLYGETPASITAAFVDVDEFMLSATIPNYVNYHKGTDRYYDVAYYQNDETHEMGYKIGYFTRYSVDELIQKAKDILCGAELSDEDKARYGI